MKTTLVILLSIIATAAADPIKIALKSGGSMAGNLVEKTITEI
jgi:hypothetical protein